MAWFFRQYSRDLKPEDARTYERAEIAAKDGKLGLWTDPNPTPPWDFRRGSRELPLKRVTPGVVEGEVIGNRNSKIYHLPNCPDYNKVAERNREIFATEAAAVAAGYRKAKNCP
jgi:micrococcal nuclease